jgi:hypothetical protein
MTTARCRRGWIEAPPWTSSSGVLRVRLALSQQVEVALRYNENHRNGVMADYAESSPARRSSEPSSGSSVRPRTGRLRRHRNLGYYQRQITRRRFRLSGAEVMVEHFISLTPHLGDDAFGRFGRGGRNVHGTGSMPAVLLPPVSGTHARYFSTETAVGQSPAG